MDVNYVINQPEPEDLLTPEGQEEFSLLMSLSLDNLLDETEQQKFQTYLERYPTFARQWQNWQVLDRQLVLAPSIEPAAGFVQRFEMRLAQQSIRSRLGRNLWIALFIIVAWVGMLVGGATLFTYVLLYQGNWLAGLVHNLAYYGAAVTQWFELTWQTVASWAATPQAIAFAFIYMVMAAGLLAFWIRFLRNTTQSNELVSSRASIELAT
ncbi:hypothetical protein BH10CHL1_BH10CHL1_21470 [soil metagenome]